MVTRTFLYEMSEASQYDSTFWSNSIWWPNNSGITWEQLSKAEKAGYSLAQPRDLCYLPIYILAFYVLRILVTKYIGLPFGIWCLGDIRKRVPPERNDELESIYVKLPAGNTMPENLHISDDWSTIRIKRWFRRRRNQDRVDRLRKFTESFWRFIVYFYFSSHSIYYFWNKPWRSEAVNVWVDFPYHNLDFSMYYYYMIQMGFYGSLLLTLFTDVRRKDFYEQIAHHFTTLCLMSGSYCANFIRIGCLLLLNNDIADWIIEVSKMLIYSRKKRAADFVVGIFAVVWIITRCFIMTGVILRCTLYEPFRLDLRSFKPQPIDLDVLPFWPVWIIFNIWMVILQGLQFFWTWLQNLQFAS